MTAFKMIGLILTLGIGFSAYAQNAQIKKVDKEREEMIKNEYIGTGVGEKKAEADAQYGTQQNISEIGNAFGSFTARMLEEQKRRDAERRAEEGPDAAEQWANRPKGPVISKGIELATWQKDAAVAIGATLRTFTDEDKEEHD